MKDVGTSAKEIGKVITDPIPLSPEGKKFQEENVQLNIVPAGGISGAPTGIGSVDDAVASVKSISKSLADITKTSKKGSQIAKIIAQERRVQDIAKAQKIPLASAKRILGIVEGTSKNTMLGFMKSKAVKWGIGGVVGATGIATWLAADNIITGTRFTSNLIAEAAAVPGADPVKIREEMEELQDTKDAGASFVNKATIANPILWPFRKIFMLNSDTAQQALDLKFEEIELILAKRAAGLPVGVGEEIAQREEEKGQQTQGSEPGAPPKDVNADLTTDIQNF